MTGSEDRQRCAVRLRPVSPGDEPFLEVLYADVHGPEFEALLADKRSRIQLLRSQHRIQSANYEAQYPQADHDLIVKAAEPIGRLLVDRSGSSIHLVDVALLSEARGEGIGTQLLEILLRESDSAKRPVSLHVAVSNPARRLYRRLGFVEETGTHGPFLAMLREPCG